MMSRPILHKPARRGLAMRGGDAIMGAMKPGNRHNVVIGRLRTKPLLAWQLLCAVVIVGLIWRQARGSTAGEVIATLLFGNLVLTALIAAAAYALVDFHRIWRQRDFYIFHDGTRLYCGSTRSWPLAAIRDVIIARNELGIWTLRLVVEDDSEVTRELVKLYLLEDAPAAVQGGVKFAVAGVRGFSGAVTVN
jgi:hypothetical protein